MWNQKYRIIFNVVSFLNRILLEWELGSQKHYGAIPKKKITKTRVPVLELKTFTVITFIFRTVLLIQRKKEKTA